jgi:hypothetical protein
VITETDLFLGYFVDGVFNSEAVETNVRAVNYCLVYCKRVLQVTPSDSGGGQIMDGQKFDG